MINEVFWRNISKKNSIRLLSVVPSKRYDTKNSQNFNNLHFNAMISVNNFPDTFYNSMKSANNHDSSSSCSTPLDLADQTYTPSSKADNTLSSPRNAKNIYQ